MFSLSRIFAWLIILYIIVGQQLARSTAKSKPISLNWMLRDDDLELLDGETGLVVPLNSKDTAR